MRLVKNFSFITILILASNAMAYKQPLHVEMSKFAGKQSVLNNASPLWNDWYYSSSTMFSYQKTLTNVTPHNDVDYSDKLLALDLLGYGADAEDTSQDVPISRAVNHFFNPQANKKLDLSFLSIENYTSPDWALENTSTAMIIIGNQSFSYRDAQYYFLQAFSGSDESSRNLAFGKMFQSLGQVIHHVQDMAQPEHTRLDAHCDSILCLQNIVDDDTSLYEELTDELLSCGAFTYTAFTEADSQITCSKLRSWNGSWHTKKIYFGGYRIPQLSHARDYWTTDDYKGMADFSSGNFITTDTAYRLKAYVPGDSLIDMLLPASDDLPFPSGKAPDTYIKEFIISDLFSGNDLGSLEKYRNYKMRFVGLHAKDNLTGEDVDISRMATVSAFTERLSKLPNARTSPMVFAINNFNLEQRAQILIPRAVGYSTGLLNYFFRYRLGVTEQVVAGQLSRWNVKNISAYDFDGCIDFYYDAAAGDRRRVISSCSKSVHIPAGGSISMDPLVVDASEKPGSLFYAVALQATGNENRPYVAVAATRFRNVVASSSSSSSNSSSSSSSQESCDSATFQIRKGESRVIRMGSKKGQYQIFAKAIPQGTAAFYNPWLEVSTYTPNKSTWSTYGYPVVFEAAARMIDDYDPATFVGHSVTATVKVNGEPSSNTILEVSVTCP